MPIVAAEKSAKLVADCNLKVYPDAPDGLAQLSSKFKDDFNAGLLSFINA